MSVQNCVLNQIWDVSLCSLTKAICKRLPGQDSLFLLQTRRMKNRMEIIFNSIKNPPALYGEGGDLFTSFCHLAQAFETRDGSAHTTEDEASPTKDDCSPSTSNQYVSHFLSARLHDVGEAGRNSNYISDDNG